MPRVVRKLELAARPTFDEQLWPINSLLVVLSGIAAGVIIGTSDFETPVVWRNGWARLASLVGSVGLLLYVANRVRGSVGRRFQLAALVSLIIHVGAGIVLYQQYLDSFAPERVATGMPPRSTAVQFEYQPRLADEGVPQQLYERPVETQAVAEREIAIERTATTTPVTIEAPPTPVPERESPIEPSMLQMQRNEFAAARRAVAESRLSRSMADAPAQQSDQVSAPQARSIDANTPQPEAQTATIDRKQTTETARIEAVETPATVEVARDTTQPARRATNEPQPAAASMSTPTLDRAVAQAAEVPRAVAIEPAAMMRVESNQPRELTVNTPLAREQTASPVVRPSTSEVTPSITPAPAVAQSNAARAEADSPPEVAQTVSSDASRSMAQATQQTEQALASPTATSAQQASAAQSPAGPAATSVARTPIASPSTAASTLTNVGSIGTGDPTVASAASSPRRTEGAPGLSATAATARPGRTTAAADSAASPVAIENPALAGTPSATDAPSAEPAATSLTRSASSTSGAGRGNSANFETGLSAPATNAQVAFAASRRTATSTESGPSVAASTPSLARGSRAQAAISSASARADDAPAADTRGGAVASPLEASSGAAVARAGSSAPRSTTAAGQGAMSLDSGAPQVVSRAGGGRGDGGGQPSVASAAATGQPARTPASGAAVSSIAAADAADAPRSPAGAGGGEQAPAAMLSAQRGGSDRAAASASAPAASNIAGGAASSLVAQVAAATGSAPSRGAEAQPSAAPAGATAGPQRNTSAPFTADSQADDVQVASAPQPRGGREGSPLEASVAGAARQPSGLPGRTTTSAVGAIAGETAIDAPVSSSAGAVAASRADSREGTGQPAVTDLTGAAPLARSTAASLPNLSGDAADVADPAASAAAGSSNAIGDNAPGPSSGPVARSSSAGVPVHVTAAPGPGGLGVEIAAAIGSRKPQSTRDSLLVHNDDARFRGREIAGAIPVEGFVREAARGFARPGIEGGAGRGQQNAKTEEAIERGLDFLVRAQQEDGSWSFQHFPGATDADTGICRSDTAATGLALLAFLGAGYDHFDDKHRHVVRRGVRYLVDQQKESGDLYTFQEKKSHESAWLYSHAIAAIALTEAYGMTGDDELAVPAQRAIDFIESSQNAQFGGWRYAPGVGADTSVTGWQLMALKSGDLAGLKIKPETYAGVRRWLDLSQKTPDDGSQYVYNSTRASNQEQSDLRRPTMTSVGLLMRLYLGWDRSREEMQRGAEHMLDYLPLYGNTRSRQRDTYYWYYATQVMFHMKGDYWRRWHGQLYPLLIGMQTKQGPMAGSWDPGGDAPDRWAGQGGRIYVTTMNLLSLEVYYRHLPLYESTAK